MTVRHPAARADAAPAAYTFGSDTYPVRDGAVVCPTAIEEDVAAALADRYGMEPSQLIDPETSDGEKESGDADDADEYDLMAHDELKAEAESRGIAENTDLRSKGSIAEALRADDE